MITPRHILKDIVERIMKDHPGETFTSADVDELQASILKEVQETLKEKGVPLDVNDFSVWSVILREELEPYCPRPTIWEHLLEES